MKLKTKKKVSNLLDTIFDLESEEVKDVLSRLDDDDRRYVLGILKELKTKGTSKLLEDLWEIDYHTRPVSIGTFLSDDDYLGKVGAGLFDPLKVEASDIFAPGRNVWELILSGAIGWGKTTLSVILLLYKIYRLSCLHNPQKFFGLIEGSLIVIGLYNVFKYKVETTSYHMMETMIDMSEYFKKSFPRNSRYTKQIQFPNNIQIISGSTELHAIGENLFGLVIDEANFMKQAATKEQKGQAYSLYTASVRRMYSRFGRLGQMPGMLILSTSKKSESDFAEGRMREVRNSHHAHICDYALWDVKPKEGNYCGKTFKVAVGDRTSSSRILDKGEVPASGIKVIDVPVEHRLAFEQDVNEALRDIGGVATYGINPLIPNRELIYQLIDRDRKHPFKLEEIVLDDNIDDQEIADSLDLHYLLNVRGSQYQPKTNHDALRRVHIDLALSQDCAGFAMGHVSHYARVRKVDTDGLEYTASEPFIYMDMMLRIRPPAGGQIPLRKIRKFVVALRALGFKIGSVTLDGWQSVDSIQILKKNRFTAKLLSVDKTDVPYSHLKRAIVEQRIGYYEYFPFLDEVSNLERNIEGKKKQGKPVVDHPDRMIDHKGSIVTGSKDVSDCVAGVVTQCIESERSKSDYPPPTSDPIDVDEEVRDLAQQGDVWIIDDYKDDVFGVR